ncbi:hypothetical protein FE257_012794 [Aspergillus nanangensis]|uniref:AA1-like domain-containing protein n=1 Tax=Aspergillus nanangensis TaxID=2582783 RepID=A0AAD4CGX3_ASPNN|nr:hypothetical protein FE257_012794 [Aspergillus nanangensis]
MKTSPLFTAALSMAGIAIAAPSSSYPYSIGELSLKHLIESQTWDFTFTLTERSPSGEAQGSTNCHVGWVNGDVAVPPASPAPCDDTRFHFFFPTGASNDENYDLAIEGPVGTGSTEIIAGPKYQCGPYDGPIGNIDRECKIVNGGAFYVKV